MWRALFRLAVVSMSVELAGCAAPPTTAGSGCAYFTDFGVYPSSAAADHSATAPGNQQRFQSSERPGGSGTGCVLPALAVEVFPNWTSSDPTTVSVSSAKDETNGTAVCTSSSANPVTLTATSTETTSPQSVSVQMSCK